MPTANRDGFGVGEGRGVGHDAPPSQREADRSEQGHGIAGTISSYFGVTARMSGTIIADMAKQTAITR
jgi:hypothetical protein